MALLPQAAAAAPPESGRGLQQPPIELPGLGRTAATAGDTWIVAGQPGRPTDRLARQHQADPILPAAGIFRVDVARARAFAAALRRAGRLDFAEADAPGRTLAFPSDPLTPKQWWLPAVVDPQATPPPVTPDSPLIAVVDGAPQLSHPELDDGNVQSVSTSPIEDEHGTATIGLVSAPANGVGVTGIWPGARVLAAPALDEVLGNACSSAVKAVGASVERGASVINMSYGFDVPDCYAHFVATQFAFAAGVVPVAAGGNEFEEGNTLIRPAVDPHVVSVAAVDRRLRSAYFSTRTNAIDLTAPGVGVITSVPRRFDRDDGNPDGYAALDGTSFSSPIVAGAAGWVRAVRPDLLNDQVAGVLRDSTRDLGPEGWEKRFGYGLLDLDAALAEPAPEHDPREPNDDIQWVSGRRFGKPAARIYGPADSTVRLRAGLDQLEDPADVYRVVLPARSRVRFKITPRFGDPDLELYERSARTTQRDRGLIDRSQRDGERVDSFVAANPRAADQVAYLSVYVNTAVSFLDAGYTLTISRP